MTIPRRRLWLVLLVGLVLAGGVWVWWAAGYAIWCKDVERISRGMSRETARQTLGRAPDNVILLKDATLARHIYNADHWYAIDGDVFVYYDSQDNVAAHQVEASGVIGCQFHRLKLRLGW